MSPRWMSVDGCSHSNSQVCKFCDFDRYYAGAYADCPWRDEDAS